MRYLSFDQGSGKSIGISITFLGEEANMMSLGGDNHCEFGQLGIRRLLAEIRLDLTNFLIQDLSKLALTNAITIK